MRNYVATLAQNIDGIVVSELRRGFALQCFQFYSGRHISCIRYTFSFIQSCFTGKRSGALYCQ